MTRLASVLFSLTFMVASAAMPAAQSHDPILIPGKEGVTQPRLVERAEPEYPEEARRRGMPGRVILRAVVGADGRVGGTETLKVSTPGLGFEEAAIAAVNEWRYEPATKDGVPVSVYMTIVTSFTLSDVPEVIGIYRIGDSDGDVVVDTPRLTRQGRVEPRLAGRLDLPQEPFELELYVSSSGEVREVDVVSEPDADPVYREIATARAWAAELEPLRVDGIEVPFVARVGVSFRGETSSIGLGGYRVEPLEGVFDPPSVQSELPYPGYPEDDDSGETVRVVVEALVSEAGEATEVAIVDAPAGRALFGALAEKAVRQWRFRPARLEGRPIPCAMQLAIEFIPPQASPGSTERGR